MWSNKTKATDSRGFMPGRDLLGPLFLLCVPPFFTTVLWHTLVNLDGSVALLAKEVGAKGLVTFIAELWPQPTLRTWQILAVFAALQLFFMKFMPGKTFHGPITPAGNRPVYIANGMQSYFATLFLFLYCSLKLELFDATILYDELGNLLVALNYFALAFCLLLYFKGRFAPSSTDAGSTGNFVFDYYWGTELYPRILGFDVKQWTNCRFGMMLWPLLLLSYAAKQYAVQGMVSESMMVSVALQLMYITKFYRWETGYWCSLDIMHDRAGFYICWGCLAFLPIVYTSPALFLVNHPVRLPPHTTALILAAGVAMVFVNYDADRQRQQVRRLDGKCVVWGRPAAVIRATYITEGGDARLGLLLASGYWGLSRHFHYIPEILAAFCWSVPALFTHALPYFYTVYLTILLVDRAVRDDYRCASKYGKFWDEYRRRVPQLIIPGVC